MTLPEQSPAALELESAQRASWARADAYIAAELEAHPFRFETDEQVAQRLRGLFIPERLRCYVPPVRPLIVSVM